MPPPRRRTRRRPQGGKGGSRRGSGGAAARRAAARRQKRRNDALRADIRDQARANQYGLMQAIEMPAYQLLSYGINLHNLSLFFKNSN